MGNYSSDDPHERYLKKNLALSRAYDIERKDKLRDKRDKGELKPIIGLCHKCKQEKACLPYKIMETGHFDGVTSVSNDVLQLCENCAPKKKLSPEVSKKQIKALLRGARRGRL